MLKARLFGNQALCYLVVLQPMLHVYGLAKGKNGILAVRLQRTR